MRCKSCGQNNPQEARFCAACGTPLVAPSAATLIPDVGASYGNAWRKLWKKFLELFLILVICFVISLPAMVGRVDARGPGSAILGIFVFAYSILIAGAIEYGVIFAYLKAARGNDLQVKDMFESFRNYWNAVLANLLVNVIVVIGLCIFVIPGIYFACKLAFTPYLVVDRKMAVIEAVKESWRMTGGHAWKVFLIGLLGIPIAIAGVICLGVGVIIAIMWITLAFASLYHAVSTSVAPAPQKTGPFV
jgi:uncharacterized membrane protein